jgi:hypothetical protein
MCGGCSADAALAICACAAAFHTRRTIELAAARFRKAQPAFAALRAAELRPLHEHHAPRRVRWRQRVHHLAQVGRARCPVGTRPGRVARAEHAVPVGPSRHEQRRLGREAIARIIDATGWQPRSVRGFLAGLKRKGITVEVLERVRQVGPNWKGAKGS